MVSDPGGLKTKVLTISISRPANDPYPPIPGLLLPLGSLSSRPLTQGHSPRTRASLGGPHCLQTQLSLGLGPCLPLRLNSCDHPPWPKSTCQQHHTVGRSVPQPGPCPAPHLPQLCLVQVCPLTAPSSQGLPPAGWVPPQWPSIACLGLPSLHTASDREQADTNAGN